MARRSVTDLAALDTAGLLEWIASLEGESDPAAELTVCCYVCRQWLPLALVGLATLLDVAAMPLRIVAINDGSLGKPECGLLSQTIRRIEIRERSEPRIDRSLARFPHARRFYREHVFGPKLFGAMAATTGERLLLVDADVLWLARPAEVIDWATGALGVDSVFMVDAGGSGAATLPPETMAAGGWTLPHALNAGVLGVRRDVFDLARAERFLGTFADAPGASRWVMEQSAWAALVGARSFQPLPATYHMVGEASPPPPRQLTGLTAVHYSASKPAMLTQGALYLMRRANRRQLSRT
jgi:hypothetical protein